VTDHRVPSSPLRHTTSAGSIWNLLETGKAQASEHAKTQWQPEPLAMDSEGWALVPVLTLLLCDFGQPSLNLSVASFRKWEG
jgi:hypothetical protein